MPLPAHVFVESAQNRDPDLNAANKVLIYICFFSFFWCEFGLREKTKK